MKDTSNNIKNILGSGVKFYPDLPRVEDLMSLVGVKFQLLDAKIIDDWEGQFGTSRFALMKIDREGQLYTSICGGRAVVRQITQLLKHSYLPGKIWCRLNLLPAESGKGDYYLLDWPDEQEKVEPAANPAEAFS